MTVRRATVADAPVIAALEKACIECPWTQAMIAETIADPLAAMYLLYEGDAFAGYGGVSLALDTAEVCNIAVEPALRRKGYGGTILQTLITHAKEHGVKELFLEVNANNAAALALYTKFGFTRVRVRKNYYASGDAIVMRLAL